MAVDVWNDIGTTQDGAILQVKRVTTLGTGNLIFRTKRAVNHGKTRTLFSVEITDATWETLYALLNP